MTRDLPLHLSICMLVALIPCSAVQAEALPLVKDKGFVTPTHKKMAGTIVFAKSEAVIATPERPEAFTDSFKISDDIFFRAYLHRSLENDFLAQGVACRSGAIRVYGMLIDGAPVGEAGHFYFEKLSSRSFSQSTSIRFDQPLNAKVDPRERAPHRGFMEVVVPALTPGTHKMKMFITGRCMARNMGNKSVHLDKYAAQGEFTLTVKEAALGKLLKSSGGKMPEAAKQDKKLEKEMVSLVQKKWPEDTALKAVILDKSWTVKHHPITSVPLSRSIPAMVAVKRSSGQCQLFRVSFSQEANKGGRGYGSTFFDGVGTTSKIPCQNVK